MIEWAWTQFLLIMQDHQVRTVLISLVVGMSAAEASAHTLRPSLEPRVAQIRIRLLVFGGSIISAFFLEPTRQGLVFGIMTGLLAPWLHQLATRYVYSHWPWAEPKALKP